ncbi:MAG: FIST C-terminal domain-containing protein [Rhodothermales bacterium]|nr:FIST C-terminal domain-containing protein [Rhodothermales bacterium]MBO6778309.1 FIST C-terminal domain-containing protein [Rhodothermales bacterium]
MQIHQQTWRPGEELTPGDAQWVLAFGSRDQISDAFSSIRAAYPEAVIVSGSTSGEIYDTEVSDDRVTITAVTFKKTRVRAASMSIEKDDCSHRAGVELAEKLSADDLQHVFVVSDGQLVNGSALAKGFNETLPENTLLTGGLAGDGTKFECTLVGLDGPPKSGQIAAVGFYGDALSVGFGSSGGWAPFGPVRTVTSSEANVLYQLDGKSALELYKLYLGDQAQHLPGSALRFPLCLMLPDGRRLVRTILSVNEEDQSMTFAGDVPHGTSVRFMRASYEDLVDGAAYAAEHAVRGLEGHSPELAILVSCVGRRIVLGQRTEEETEVVRETIGAAAKMTGFYSYGELAPTAHADWCELHNQTMTITTLREAA